MYPYLSPVFSKQRRAEVANHHPETSIFVFSERRIILCYRYEVSFALEYLRNNRLLAKHESVGLLANSCEPSPAVQIFLLPLITMSLLLRQRCLASPGLSRLVPGCAANAPATPSYVPLSHSPNVPD